MARLSKKKIKAALEQNNGNVSAAARALNCTRKTLYNHINEDEKLKALLEDARENLVDLAEEHLVKNIKDGDTTAIIFTLKTRGAERGWSEKSRIELTGANGGPVETAGVQVNINDMPQEQLGDRYRDILAKSKK